MPRTQIGDCFEKQSTTPFTRRRQVWEVVAYRVIHAVGHVTLRDRGGLLGDKMVSAALLEDRSHYQPLGPASDPAGPAPSASSSG